MVLFEYLGLLHPPSGKGLAVLVVVKTLSLRFDRLPLTAARTTLVVYIEHARPCPVRLLPNNAHYAQTQVLGDPALVEVMELLRGKLVADDLARLGKRGESAGLVGIVRREIRLARLPDVLVLVPVRNETVDALAPEVLGLFRPHDEPWFL